MILSFIIDKLPVFKFQHNGIKICNRICIIYTFKRSVFYFILTCCFIVFKVVPRHLDAAQKHSHCMNRCKLRPWNLLQFLNPFSFLILRISIQSIETAIQLIHIRFIRICMVNFQNFYKTDNIKF